MNKNLLAVRFRSPKTNKMAAFKNQAEITDFVKKIILDDSDEFEDSVKLTAFYKSKLGDKITNPTVSWLLNFQLFKTTSLTTLQIDALVPLSDLFPLFTRLITVWSQKVFIEQASIEYHIRINTAIISCLRRLTDDHDRLAPLLPRFLTAIPIYLEASREKVSRMGMAVGESCLSIVNSSIKLDFELDYEKLGVKWIKELLSGPWKRPVTEVPKCKAKPAKAMVVLSDSDSDDDDGTVVYPYFPSRPNTDLEPKYIAPSLALIKSNDPTKIAAGLGALKNNIQKSSNLALEEGSDEILSTLLPLHDEYDLENFDDLWNGVMVEITLNLPSKTISNVIKLFTANHSIVTRLRSLNLLLTIPMVSTEDTKSVQYYASTFLPPLFNLCKIPKVYTDLFQTPVYNRIGKRLIQTLTFLTIKDNLQSSFETLTEFILSFQRLYAPFRLELLQSILVILTASPVKVDLGGFAKEIVKDCFDEEIMGVYRKIEELVVCLV